MTVGDITTILGFFSLSFDQKPCSSCGEKLSDFFFSEVYWGCHRESLSIKNSTLIRIVREQLPNICSTFTRKPQHRCSCTLTRPSKFACIYLKDGRTSTDNNHGTFDSKNFNFQPSSRLPSLLNCARIFFFFLTKMKH